MGLRAVTIDLPSLWKQLGIAARGETVVFSDTAPLASIRRSMIAPPA